MSNNPTLAYSSLFCDVTVQATVPPFPPFPVQPAPSLTQDQKREQRKLARSAKKSQKQADLLQKKIDEKRCINSGKIKVIDRKTADVLQTARIVGDEDATGGRFVPQKWQSKPLTVELVDGFLKPRQEETEIRSKQKPDTLIPKNKGKKREVPKEKFTRLKKAILQERLRVVNDHEQNVSEEIFSGLEEIDLSERPLGSSDIRHSRNFRPYCNHFITPEIRQLSEELLQKLVAFKDRSHQANPIKAKAHRRYVVGLNELMKYLLAKQLTLIVIAPDMEPKQCLDEVVQHIQSHAKALKVPVIFSLKRRKLGWIFNKKVPVGAIGIFSYDGCASVVERLLDLVKIESENYKKV